MRPWRHTTSTELSYDANGNLVQTDEDVASGSDPPETLTTVRAYDLLNRLTGETQPLPDGGTRTVGYTYYGNGARKSVTDPAGGVTQYTYDGQNRLQSATTGFGSGDARTTSYAYWPDSLLQTVSYPNGVVAAHDYDKADRLLTLASTQGVTAVSSYVYTYDDNGNRLTQVETNGGTTETTSYGFDDLDRLATITYPVDATYPLGRVVTYGYDAVGNRTRETEKDSTEALLADKQGVFDNVNRLTQLDDLLVPAESTSFTWDANGNQTSKTTNGVTTINLYDTRDKLVEVQQGASIVGRFQYDSQGRRTKKIGEEGVRQYVYDQTSLLVEYDDAGTAKAKYDYGSDRLISLTRADEGRRYFTLDGLRSVTNLTDESGLTVASYHLDTWGNYRFPTELDASRNRFGFTGHIWDAETGLYNAKARYYDPELGRFLTQDSFLGQIDNPPSLHRYFYANDNPVRYIDPTGNYSWEEFKGDAKGAGSAALDFTTGALVAWSSDVIPGLDRSRPEPNSYAQQLGMEFGDTAAVVQGVAESYFSAQLFAGAIASGGGGTLSLVVPGVGELTAPAGWTAAAGLAVAGTGVGLHAANTMSTAGKNLSKPRKFDGNGTVKESTPSKANPAPTTTDPLPAAGGGAPSEPVLKPAARRARDTNPNLRELPPGESRTPEANKEARNFYKRNKPEARAAFEERTGEAWPVDAEAGRPQWGEHPRQLKEGGDPLFVEPGVGPDPNAQHMKVGPDGLTDHQRWGSQGPPARAAKAAAREQAAPAATPSPGTTIPLDEKKPK